MEALLVCGLMIHVSVPVIRKSKTRFAISGEEYGLLLNLEWAS